MAAARPISASFGRLRRAGAWRLPRVRSLASSAGGRRQFGVVDRRSLRRNSGVGDRREVEARAARLAAFAPRAPTKRPEIGETSSLFEALRLHLPLRQLGSITY